MPIVDDGEDVPIKMDSEFTPEESQNTIKIGKNKKELMLKYPIELLNKHAFICGVPGSGKHTRCYIWLRNYIKTKFHLW